MGTCLTAGERDSRTWDSNQGSATTWRSGMAEEAEGCSSERDTGRPMAIHVGVGGNQHNPAKQLGFS